MVIFLYRYIITQVNFNKVYLTEKYSKEKHIGREITYGKTSNKEMFRTVVN